MAAEQDIQSDLTICALSGGESQAPLCLSPSFSWTRERFSCSSSCSPAIPLQMLTLCKVTDSLFISNSRSACDENLLVQERITFCVNVSRQQPFPSFQQVQTLRVPVFDDPSEDLYRYFERCSDAIEGAVQSGGKCLVYCKNGRSRSAAICTAYLMKHQNLSLKDAFEVLWACRKNNYLVL